LNQNEKVQTDLRHLAGGVAHALKGMYGTDYEFVLIVVMPAADEPNTVRLNTVTGITDPDKMFQIGQHLIDMAKAQRGQQLDPDNDGDVQGHA
jgi:hypothetical protein